MSRGLVRVRIRAARPADAAARGELLRASLHDYFLSAWLLFFFQEVVLQCMVSIGAVLFIFVGLSPLQCALLLPAAALVVAASVLMAHAAHADALVQRMRAEEGGFIAEVCGAPGGLPPSTITPITVSDDSDDDHRFWQIIGTISVSEAPSWAGYGSCRVHALCVAVAWRRRGVATHLLASVATWAEKHNRSELAATATEIQASARALLSRSGYVCKAAGLRPLLGGAIHLNVAYFTQTLQHYRSTTVNLSFELSGTYQHLVELRLESLDE